MSIPSRILITGCTGFVGSHLVEQCRKRYPQAELFGVTGHQTFHTLTPGMSDVKLLVADITREEAIRKVVAMSQPDLIIHLAAQSSVSASWRDSFGTLEVNAGGVIPLLEEFYENPYNNTACYTPKTSPYARSAHFDLQTPMQSQK